MDINNIIKNTRQPELYTPGTAVMWTDEYISKQLLEVHLDKENDLASRKESTILKTIEWILSQTNNNVLNILDLGCGPGLYTELLAQKGRNVTGIDFSKNSIEYARKSAVKNKLNIRYINENYLDVNLGKNRFDLIIMIYTDYCVLQPEDRKSLLLKIKSALKQNGIFIFDVNSDKDMELKLAPKSWEAAEKGFWRNEPYLTLSESFIYPEDKVVLYQHIVSDKKKTEVYRFYTRFFSEKDLKNELIGNGFSEFSFYTDVLPREGIWSGENIIFCVVKNSN